MLVPTQDKMNINQVITKRCENPHVWLAWYFLIQIQSIGKLMQNIISKVCTWHHNFEICANSTNIRV